MTTQWTTKLGLAASGPLIEGWQQLEQAALQATAGSPHWLVSQLPTGTGKTQSIGLLLALPNRMQHPGALVVTKFQEEANQIEKNVNEHAGSPIARALHGKSPTDGTDLGSYPVLIITHAAYELALREIADNGFSSRWDRYKNYVQADRRLLIIDEFFDWTDCYSINMSNLRAMSADLSAHVQGSVRADIQQLMALASALSNEGEGQCSEQFLSHLQFSALSSIDIQAISHQVEVLPHEALAQWSDALNQRTKYLDELCKLNAIVRIGYAWRSRRGKRTLLHSSRSLLEHSRMRGIILDATADVDPVYSLMADRVKLLPRPAGMRRYDNVTLHASLGHSVGKERLSKVGKDEWPVLWNELAPKLAGKQTLICAHKNMLPSIREYVPEGSGAEFVNWGNIDGRNDWAHCNGVVQFGLPYLDNVAPAQRYFALQGRQDDDWFTGERNFGKHTDIRSALGNGFVARNVVQSINRVGCRRMIDTEGNCQPTDVYMLLPKGETGVNVLRSIEQQMPGIQGNEWETGVSKRKARKIPTELRLVSYFRDAEPGHYLKSEVARSLFIKGNSLERLVSKLRDETSTVFNTLTDIGVRYYSTSGRGKEAYFIKT